MNRKGIRLVAPLALATAATLGLGLSQPAQAADSTGETQLVTSDQLGDLYHTVRHADGTWDYHASFPDQWVTPTDMSAADVDGRLEVMMLINGLPQVSELGPDGTWTTTNGDQVPTIGNDRLRSAAIVANGDTLRVVELDGAGHTVGVTDRISTGWTPVKTRIANGSPKFDGKEIAAAQVGGELQITTLSDSTEALGKPRLDHGILDADGYWAGFAPIDLHGQGSPARIGMTASNSEMQLTYSTLDGALFHLIRHADHTWQAPGNVESATGGGTVGEWVTIAGV